MATWYETSSGGRITPVEVVKATANFVTLSGQKSRTARLSSWRSYFPTFREAYDYWVSCFEQARTRALDDLNRAEAKLARLRETYADVLATNPVDEKESNTP